MEIVIGIDPGKTGAVAIFRNKKFHSVFDCPLGVGKNGKSEFNIPEMAKLLKAGEYDKDCKRSAIIEQQHAFAQQGGVGNFTSGQGYGIWLTSLFMTGFNANLVTSQMWRGVIFTESEKNQIQSLETLKERKAARKALSIQRAKELWPKSIPYLSRKKDDGRAEAILIATAGIRMRI